MYSVYTFLILEYTTQLQILDGKVISYLHLIAFLSSYIMRCNVTGLELIPKRAGTVEGPRRQTEKILSSKNSMVCLEFSATKKGQLSNTVQGDHISYMQERLKRSLAALSPFLLPTCAVKENQVRRNDQKQKGVLRSSKESLSVLFLQHLKCLQTTI